jgi:hypothetical protein
VNWPLNVPVRDDKFDTDDETAVNELDMFSSSVRFASICAAVRGAPLRILLVIAILYYTCMVLFVIQVNINI